MTVSPNAGPNLEDLFHLFPSAPDLPSYQLVPPEQVPEPYHRLLVHQEHMTVTVEAFHGDLVNVRVLTTNLTPDWYARKILLTLQQTGRIVQFGIVRVLLKHCGPAVQAEILAQKTPLGRILIQHDVLRRIEPTAYLRVAAGPWIRDWFGLPPRETYGRLGIIYCDGHPAIELLEIVAPV